jgi:hypothetical protein
LSHFYFIGTIFQAFVRLLAKLASGAQLDQYQLKQGIIYHKEKISWEEMLEHSNSYLLHCILALWFATLGAM